MPSKRRSGITWSMLDRLFWTGLIFMFCSTLSAQETYWKDQRIMQLEEITPQLIESVQQMHEKIRSVAISSVSFGDNLPDNFRRVATARIHQSLTQLSKLKVSVCETCTQIRTVIAGSYLKITRGIADDDFRIKTAKSLNVKGFLDIALFMTEDRQLSIALNAFEASNGEIVYSKIITGEPAKKESHVHVFLAKMQTPISDNSTKNVFINHTAMQLGVEMIIRLDSNWSFSGGGSIFSDDNNNLVTKYEKPINGFTLDGLVSYDLFSFGGNQADVSISGGLGMIFAAALNSPMYVKGGLNLTVSEQLTLGFNYMNILSSNDDTFKMPNMTNITLGWKF